MNLARSFGYHRIAVLAIALLVGCGVETTPDTTEPSSDEGPQPTRVSVQLNWYPEAEHGGIYQADVEGLYREAGFAVDIRPGGRATPVGAELQMGRVQFAIANADDVVVFRRQGLDVVAVMAVVQDSPRCILVRRDSGVRSFEDLAGMTLQRQAGRFFLEFMRSKGILEGVEEVPYHGSVSSMISDPKIAIQAYSFAEPYLAREQEVETTTLMVSELGWNPYSSVLVTTQRLIREQPEVVRRFVTATREGWRRYFEDPAPGNRAVLAANEHGMTAGALDFGVAEMKPLALPKGMTSDRLGEMSADRWKELVDQIQQLDPDGGEPVDASSCYTSEFL